MLVKPGASPLMLESYSEDAACKLYSRLLNSDEYAPY